MRPSTTTDPCSPSALDDDALLAAAKAWRARALRGDRSANGRAHELEVELRRRLGPAQPIVRSATGSELIGQVAYITLVGAPGGSF